MPDGVNFEIVAITALKPIEPRRYIQDTYTHSGNGRGITWGLCHFRDILKVGGDSQSMNMLVCFDCDPSLDLEDPQMKESDIFNDPEINYKFGLSEKQLERIKGS